jgi:SAM-dependent methyltransferase
MDGPVGFKTMSSALPDAKRYHGWILRMLVPWLRGIALEAGFGYGQYTPKLACHVDRLVAIDCDPECVQRLQGRIANTQAQVADLTNPGFADDVGRATYDVVVCLNVLEHIEDAVSTLTSFYEALKPGGVVLLLVPAHPKLYGPMDEMAGHFRRYTRHSMRQSLRASGFRVARLQYFNPLGGLGWWLNARLVRPSSLSDPLINRQILWYDRFVLPFSRLLTPLTRRFFGQSLFAVARRPKQPDAVAGG